VNKALTFDDVTLVPSYCPFDSRKDVDTSCDLGFGKIDIPIVSAPMDTVSEESLAVALSGLGGVTLLHIFMELEAQVAMYKSIIIRFPFDKHHLVGIAFGVAEKEDQRIDALYELGCRLFCLDVAHGHSKFAGKAVKKIKTKYPDTFVIAGSVCTLAVAYYLASCGADMIRTGLSTGCFVPGSSVLTNSGYKSINEIQIGDMVLTHTNTFQKVLNTFQEDRKEYLVQVNNIQCTRNHEFYVINKSDASLVNDDNISIHASWIPAEFLDKELHLLVEFD
jgi:IMP dehydrogenase